MGLTPTTPDYKALAKSWASTTPGKVGIGILAVVGLTLTGVVIYDLKAILEYANNVILDTTSLIIHTVILAAITSPIWEPQIRRMTIMGYKSFIRALTGIFITIDPIGILRETIIKFKQRLVVLDQGLAGLAGSKRALEGDIDQAKSDISKAGSSLDVYTEKINALQALKTPSRDQLLELNRMKLNKGGTFEDIGDKKNTIDEEQTLLDVTTNLYYNMAEIRDLAEYNIRHLTDKVDYAEKKRKSILAAKKSLGAAIGIMKGDPREIEMFDRSLAYLNDEATNTLGAIDDFNRWAERSLTDKQIQSGVAAREGEKVFASMKQKLAITDGDGPAVMDTTQTSDGVYTPVERNLPAATDDYSKYLK